MKNRIHLTFCLIFVSILSHSQSPWVPSVNEGFLQFAYSGLFFDQVRYNNELITPGRETVDQTYQAYLDFGLLPKLGITASIPFKFYSIDEGSGKFSGLGNVSLGLKYQLTNKNATTAIGLTYDVTSQNSDQQLGLRSGFDAHTVTPYFSIGSGTKKTYFYANLGYGIRTNSYSDFLRVSGEFGYKIFKHAYLIGTIDLTNPTQKDSGFFIIDDPAFVASASFLDRQSFNGAGIKFLYDFLPEKYGISLSTIGALGSDNTPFSRSYNVGIYHKF